MSKIISSWSLYYHLLILDHFLSLFKNAKIGILDADVFGPSLPSLTGIHDSPDLNKG